MAQTDTPKLDAGDRFPHLELELVGGGSLALPTNERTVVLIYRGKW